jgi:hypothetical protein
MILMMMYVRMYVCVPSKMCSWCSTTVQRTVQSCPTTSKKERIGPSMSGTSRAHLWDGRRTCQRSTCSKGRTSRIHTHGTLLRFFRRRSLQTQWKIRHRRRHHGIAMTFTRKEGCGCSGGRSRSRGTSMGSRTRRRSTSPHHSHVQWKRRWDVTIIGSPKEKRLFTVVLITLRHAHVNGQHHIHGGSRRSHQQGTRGRRSRRRFHHASSR